MKKILVTLLSLALLLTSSGVWGSGATGAGTENKSFNHELAPVNKDAIADKLIHDGKLSPNASQDEVLQALKNYLGNINTAIRPTKLDQRRAGLLNGKLEEALKNSTFKGNKLGQSKKSSLAPAEPAAYPARQKTVRVLVVLAEYADMDHNTMPAPANPKRSYWTKDFSLQHYQNLLFGEGFYTTPENIKSPTFTEYFREQSNGSLAVEGTVLGWYKLPGNAAFYGGDSADGSIQDVNARVFVRDAIDAAAANNPAFNFSDYDAEDPYDLDNDTIFNEPDGIIDHLMVIHAGMGQEEGAPAEAIWSHSSSMEEPYTIPGTSVKINAYTTEPENGAVGVFAHEFVHDLGIPDDYDTIYSADGEPVEYWSIMSGGSWSGSPGGTMPTGINPWSRYKLGLLHGGSWINTETLKLEDLRTASYKTLDTASMNTGNTQALIIEIPSADNFLIVNQPTQGTYEFWGGRKSDSDHTMTLNNIDLKDKTAASLKYNIWYDIEEGYDAGFVQVSCDSGATWESLSTPNTRTIEGFYNGKPVYSGSSKTWITETVDLGKYLGKDLSLRFRYKTDAGLEMEGMYLDNIVLSSADLSGNMKVLAEEGAENGFGQFDNYKNGWTISDGIRRGNRYYVAEWRSHIGVDEGLKYNARACVEYNRGLLLWYVNELYSDNWVGIHPGYGQIGVVDANQYVYLNSGIGNGNEYGSRAGYMPFVQLHDAAFSLDKAADMDLSIYAWAKNPNLSAKQAVPLFDDSNSYFSAKSPFSGLILPKLGIRFRVVGNAPDYSRGEILIGR